MSDLSAYVDFSVTLNKHSANITLTDTSSYPAGVSPSSIVFSVVQPDGISVSGSSATQELRLATDGSFQNGVYSFVYTVNAEGYTATVKVKSYTLKYTAATLVIEELLDVFTPQLRVADGTEYNQDFITYSTTTRAWSADAVKVGSNTATITGTSSTFNMIYTDSKYYDARYDVTFISQPVYTSSWFSIVDYLTLKKSYDVYTPLTLGQLLTNLSTLKDSIQECCGSDLIQQKYYKAVSIYEHLTQRGNVGDKVGLYKYVEQLERIFNPYGVKTHTNAPIPPYVWNTNTSSGVQQWTYTNTVDGNTVAYVPDLVGKEVIWVQKEILPLSKSQYSWNSNTGQLFLTDTAMTVNEHLFILASAIGATGSSDLIIQLPEGATSYVVPAGSLVEKILVVSTIPISVAVGTAVGGTDIFDYSSVDTVAVLSQDKYFATQTTIYFSGVLSDTVIKIYKR